MTRLAHTEAEELIKWLTEHFKTCAKGDVRIEQSGESGIGTNTYVRCNCGWHRDITDYSKW